MTDAAHFTRPEQLRDRARSKSAPSARRTRPTCWLALEHSSTQTLQRRFFVLKRFFSDKERAFFMNVDFKSHVALVACVQEEGHNIIAGSGRYVVSEPGQAGVAFLVVDSWQGRGIGGLLTRHLITLAREAGLERADRGSPAGKCGDAPGVRQMGF